MTIKTPFSLSRKIAVITGFGAPKDALSNGGAIARLFAKQGAVIEGLDISAKDAHRTQLRPSSMREGRLFSHLVMLLLRQILTAG